MSLELIKSVIEKDREIREQIYKTDDIKSVNDLFNKRLDLIYDAISKIGNVELTLFLTSLSMNINNELQLYLLQNKIKNQFIDVYKELHYLKSGVNNQ